MNDNYDVIVVGGGPAGAATATHLARAGRAVLLLERATFPRDKPCGEFLSPPVRGLLGELGAWTAIRDAGARDVPAARIRCADGQSFGSGYPDGAKGLSIDRLTLDATLFANARAAGADAREGVAVRDVLRERGRIVGVRTNFGAFRAPLVVGADGGKSRIARAMGVVRPLPRLQKIALVAHYADVVSGDAVEMHLAESGAVCGFGPGPRDTADVTIVVDESEARAVAAAGPDDYFERALAQFPELTARLGAAARRTRLATCGTFGHVSTRTVADGALLVGDAATFIDPFTGEGVYFALRGAQLASEAILRGDLPRYERARRRELAPKYAVCGLVQRVVHRPALLAWAAPRLARRPVLTERILGVTGDLESPWRLLSPAYLLAVLTA